MILTHDVTATLVPVTGSTIPLTVQGGSATLDEGWAPYAQTTLTVGVPATLADLAAIDPRLEPRVTITGSDGTTTRTFDLALRGRKVNHNDATISLTLTSDEMLLQGYRRIASTADASPLVDQASLRAVIDNHVLNLFGASLAAGSTDADFTTYSVLTNLIPNPSPVNDLYGWTDIGNTNMTRSSSLFGEHGYVVDLKARTTHAAEGMTVSVGGEIPSLGTPLITIDPNTKYTFTARMKADTAGKHWKVRLIMEDAAGTGITFDGPSTVLGTGMTTLSVTGTSLYASDGTSTLYAIPLLVCIDSVTAGDSFIADAAMLTQGDGTETDTVTALTYFDGDSGPAGYSYAWQDLRFQSPSTRTPVLDRTPDLLTWQLGTSAWDFITPLLSASGLRLFCDESRVWRLVDSSYTVAGTVTVDVGENAYTIADTIDLDATADDGSQLWADAVGIRYSWKDAIWGLDHVQVDTAGATVPLAGVFLDLAQPYPGPGGAANRLAAMQKLGRQFDLTARLDYTATPGMAAESTVPLTNPQTGTVTAVTFSFDSDDMTVGTSNLADA